MDDSRREPALTFAGAFVAAFVASIRPIRSWDYFWQLASGRWIVEHHALPLRDPFAVASDRNVWVDGEWLFQLLVRGVQKIGGHDGAILLKAFVVASAFALVAAVVARRAGAALALSIAAICFYGDAWRMDVRPSTFAILFLALLITALDLRWRTLVLFAVTVLWMNVHPSAILAPVIAAAYAFDGGLRQRWQTILAAAAALFVNPYGYEGVAAPFRLAATIEAGRFINSEWLPSRPSWFPLLYATAIGAAILFAVRFAAVRKFAPPAVFAMCAVLAMHSMRHQDLYYGALPLLVAPYLPPLRSRRLTVTAAAGGLLVLLASWTSWPFGFGLERSWFPESAVRQLRATGLGGNIYNADQFGGYLIWNFYPARRVMQDGRNELYGRFLAEYDAARLDSRKWTALLRQYDVKLAVDEYHPEHLTVRDASGRERPAAASELYFPRLHWALIGFDDVAMVFARRDAYPPARLAPLEYRILVPDAPGRLASLDRASRAAALAEIERAAKAGGTDAVTARMRRELE